MSDIDLPPTGISSTQSEPAIKRRKGWSPNRKKPCEPWDETDFKKVVDRMVEIRRFSPRVKLLALVNEAQKVLPESKHRQIKSVGKGGGALDLPERFEKAWNDYCQQSGTTTLSHPSEIPAAPVVPNVAPHRRKRSAQRWTNEDRANVVAWMVEGRLEDPHASTLSIFQHAQERLPREKHKVVLTVGLIPDIIEQFNNEWLERVTAPAMPRIVELEREKIVVTDPGALSLQQLLGEVGRRLDSLVGSSNEIAEVVSSVASQTLQRAIGATPLPPSKPEKLQIGVLGFVNAKFQGIKERVGNLPNLEVLNLGSYDVPRAPHVPQRVHHVIMQTSLPHKVTNGLPSSLLLHKVTTPTEAADKIREIVGGRVILDVVHGRNGNAPTPPQIAA